MQDVSDCTSCDKGYILWNHKCLIECPEDFIEVYIQGNNQSCVDGYEYCQKLAYPHYFDYDEQVCKACSKNCLNCTSAIHCIQCYDGYYKYYETDSNGNENSLCKSDCVFDGCKTCEDNVCTECSLGP